MPSEKARASDGGATVTVAQGALAPRKVEVVAPFGVTVGDITAKHGDVIEIPGDVARVLLGQGAVVPAK